MGDLLNLVSGIEEERAGINANISLGTSVLFELE